MMKLFVKHVHVHVLILRRDGFTCSLVIDSGDLSSGPHVLEMRTTTAIFVSYGSIYSA